MTTAAPSTALAAIQPAFTNPERLALAGFLAGYRGLTRGAYTLDLRQFTTWCRVRSLNLFAVRRADIEGYARDLEARGRARATVTRRLCTIAGFYRYAPRPQREREPPLGAAWRLPALQTPDSRSGATQAVSYGLEFGEARLEARADIASIDQREPFRDILTVTPPCGDAPVDHRAGDDVPRASARRLGEPDGCAAPCRRVTELPGELGRAAPQ
jgi:Phage integrase, N-terminal SAM-like domain